MSDQTMSIDGAVQLMKQEDSRLAKPVPVDGLPPMTFSCSFSNDATTPEEIASLPWSCPPDLLEFWSIARSARLFEDQEYGQWGLEILDPLEAAKTTSYCQQRRRRDFIDGDMVIGKFLGDADLLVIRCDSTASDYGQMLVALPIDPRADWYKVEPTFRFFLDKYVKSGGEKFWTKTE